MAGRRKIPNFHDLPKEVLGEILSKAASNSIEDYARAKATCKAFRDASQLYPVLKNVSLANIVPVPWLKNLGDLFREGLILYFTHEDTHVGLEYLKLAADVGHEAAKYSFGIMVLLFGDFYFPKGLEVLDSIGQEYHANPTKVIWSCRYKAAEVLSYT
ncbi:hypothetical protein COLO4_16089 [Corchorus olitorius]|uniref:At2g35280-like TPR domain-containing protein n=1 Tax=Corchorus olitorius TaxID=93759 RepID=A0A1R3JJL5_9ROSI|nr:hypothetical protein COLO4_16089 [Corchorus olitorius]